MRILSVIVMAAFLPMSFREVPGAGSLSASERLLPLLAVSSCAPALAAESGRKQAGGKKNGKAATRKKKGKGLHGESWAFGHSASRKEALWESGVGGETLQHRATGGGKGKAVGNTASIEASLQREAARQKKDEEQRKRGGLGMSLDTDESVWRPETPGGPDKPDETLSIGSSRHRLRAYGGVKSEDLSISVGPEITVKDRDNQGHFSRSDEPDSAVGMGMRFSWDF